MKYIKIGEKENGRYHKSEELSLDQFQRLMGENITEFVIPKKTVWNVISGKYKKEIREATIYRNAQIQLIKDIRDHIIFLINADKKGKKFNL